MGELATADAGDASSHRRAPLPHLLDIDGVAEHLGVTVRHVRRLVYERRIPFIKWGHLLRFDPDELAAWLDSMRQSPSADRSLSTHRGIGDACHHTSPPGVASRIRRGRR
ncbi:MAG: hypothetical protein JWO37_431 [Acidimicrobiales bacterium]|jgi:excisionase family DNA binding protein|nr:hypothetical protein [Acidimicrobiales bacterium]